MQNNTILDNMLEFCCKRVSDEFPHLTFGGTGAKGRYHEQIYIDPTEEGALERFIALLRRKKMKETFELEVPVGLTYSKVMTVNGCCLRLIEDKGYGPERMYRLDVLFA